MEEVVCMLNMEKAYGHVSRDILDHMIAKMGFGWKWRSWIWVWIFIIFFFMLINGKSEGF